MLTITAVPQLLRTLVIGAALAATPAISSAGIFLSIGIAPPPLPVYEQPLCPGDGYIWTPGYWAYGDEGYFWVPGTWVIAPFVGGLWTPGYWGWGGGLYAWHAGYWGTHIGFYGGVNYGFGYGGFGYEGGYWNNGRFNYNRSVNNVNITNIHNVYNKTVVNNVNVNRTSFNGGTCGIQARASAAETAAASERHVGATAVQTQHQQAAFGNRALLASVNHGAPAIAATQRPGAFNGTGVVRASAAGGNFNQSAYRTPAPQTASRNPAGNTFGRTAQNAPPTRNVPAPQSTPQRTPQSQGGNRFGTPQSAQSAPRAQANVARPMPQRAPAQPVQNMSRPQSQPQTQRFENARPQSQPRPQAAAPRPQAAPRAQAAPRVQSAPRAQPSHGGGEHH